MPPKQRFLAECLFYKTRGGSGSKFLLNSPRVLEKAVVYLLLEFREPMVPLECKPRVLFENVVYRVFGLLPREKALEAIDDVDIRDCLRLPGKIAID